MFVLELKKLSFILQNIVKQIFMKDKIIVLYDKLRTDLYVIKISIFDLSLHV